ncbi:twin-arginine translocase subunit TatC [Sporolituus thermophilus]|uniref:Sec-independent protein translocase protein TatC n=1 Tax=Sporolituus thermophilus DSM 23256 TaxID=1123285 RepID=A0A1G7MCJ3_9FIRM|nr:twin-arginine translocase subunit TatC [Sporolituus thermophilus]SDF59366.1 sec-independent protein translocase protein TatC [Sporolituus thermophilus DSM 23256]
MDQTRLSLVEHLTDLRKAIIVALLSLLIATAIGYCLAPSLFITLKKVLPVANIVYFGPIDGLYLHIRLAILLGLVLAFPAIAASLVWFVAPGLYRQEKAVLLSGGTVAVALFGLGAVYSLFVLLPRVMDFLLAFAPAGMMPLIAGEEYLNFIVSFLVYTGLAFNLPLLFFVLLRYNLVSPAFVAGQRKACFGLLTGLTLLLAPGGDLAAQLLLALPLYLLFEVALYTARLVKKYSIQLWR